MGKRPALTGDIANIAHFQAHLLAYFPYDAVLNGLAWLDEASQGTVNTWKKARRTRQKDFIATGNQHDHAGRQTGIVAQPTIMAFHGPLTVDRCQRFATGPAKPVFPCPGRNLPGIAKQSRVFGISVEQMLAKALPLAARQIRLISELSQIHRHSVVIPKPIFGHCRQSLLAYPGVRKQRPLGIQKKTTRTLQYNPRARQTGRNTARLPACVHQQATANLSASTLRSASSRTSLRDAPRSEERRGGKER